MSYILEALKKAQAERQLGHAPTLDQQPLAPAPAPEAPVRRMALWAALAVLALGAAVFAAVTWRSRAAVTPLPPVAAAQPAPAQQAAPAPPATVFAPAPAPAKAVAPIPVPPPAPVHIAEEAPKPARSAEVAARPAPPAPVPAPMEPVYPTLRELPEAIARELPQVSIGGYIYSPNPADRLLLIDKVLRHEGEEVAPGLTLEKLLPKAAVMNYRGYRYRVPY